MNFRVGIGYDAHRLVEGRPLVLGGVTVPYGKGLEGHSDADALAHALCDAVLGAAALGDIGRHFPDTDPRWKGADSIALLKECVRMAVGRGFDVVNADAVIVAQAPKMAPHIPSMVDVLARALGVEKGAVNVKAKTTEGMGFEGRGEGISAQAVVMLRID
jgi:2-C-methyl-D-erythritol 2,4-cyclodiphosphate synthase